MEKIQRSRMLWRVPLAVAILMVLFWGIWAIFAPVPKTTEIMMTKDWVVQLPFAISRWWDILFAPIWTFILVFLFTPKKVKGDRDLFFGLVVGLGFGLVIGLGVDLVIGLGVGLIIGLGFGLGFGLVFGMGVGLRFLFSNKLWASVFHWLGGK